MSLSYTRNETKVKSVWVTCWLEDVQSTSSVKAETPQELWDAVAEMENQRENIVVVVIE